MTAGRPSTYTEEVGEAICNRISNGESLRSICAEEGMPDKTTVLRWLRDFEKFRTHYTIAREAQADVLADEILDIADDGSNDWMLRKFGDDEAWVQNGEAMRRSQLRIDARKWLAGKLRPKKYGDKVQNEITGADGGPVQTMLVTGVPRAGRDD
jgi:hypothetical protein